MSKNNAPNRHEVFTPWVDKNFAGETALEKFEAASEYLGYSWPYIRDVYYGTRPISLKFAKAIRSCGLRAPSLEALTDD